MKVWITKYALTTGIFETEVRDEGNGMVSQKNPNCYNTHYHGQEWHLTSLSAIAKAEDMRKKKIAALEKQIVRLGKMDFHKITQAQEGQGLLIGSEP
jgi:hypothetical protein